jgi:hypothetical protein
MRRSAKKILKFENILSGEKTLSKLNTIHKDGNIYIPTTQLNSNEP